MLCFGLNSLTNFPISHLQLAPTLKPTPTPVESAPEPVPAPVPESPPTPEPINPTPAQTEAPVQTPDFVLPGSSAAPSKKGGETDDSFSNLYPGAPSSAYIHSNSVVTAVIAIGSAMVWTLAGFV